VANKADKTRCAYMQHLLVIARYRLVSVGDEMLNGHGHNVR
jgi:hypothetical protein